MSAPLPSVQETVALAPHTSLGVGGPAQYFLAAKNEAELIEAVRWADRYGVDLHVLGGGSNVVVSDAGVDGLVLAIRLRGLSWHDAGVVAAAGEPWDGLVAATVERGLAGLECLSGIPGLVGATPIQNVGAYGQEVAEVLDKVRVFDRKTHEIVELSAAECGFSYRDSRFKSQEPSRFVVLSVSYALNAGGAPALRYPELSRVVAGRDAPSLADVREAVLAIRKTKSMVIEPGDPNARSCGSFFLNPIVSADAAREVEARVGKPNMPAYPQRDGRIKLSAAWLIERAGFEKGTAHGNVAISSRHSLAIVCHDSARAAEVASLARLIRNRVQERFGIQLVPEPNFWGYASLDDGLPDERLA